jgi:hypothetical protein
MEGVSRLSSLYTESLATRRGRGERQRRLITTYVQHRPNIVAAGSSARFPHAGDVTNRFQCAQRNTFI